jgi:hypothetical protein
VQRENACDSAIDLQHIESAISTVLLRLRLQNPMVATISKLQSITLDF